VIAYPADGILLPPNLDALEVQFSGVPAATLYEVAFENAGTDVRVETHCNAITDARGALTSGCALDLDQATWTLLANANRGGDPLMVSVRATTDGVCSTPPSSTVGVSFAQDDLAQGAVYYGQLSLVPDVTKPDGIYAYDFAQHQAGIQPVLTVTPTSNACVGCHALSRDGTRMTYGTDDGDHDDEYSDQQALLYDAVNRIIIPTTGLRPGFKAFTHDGSRMLASSGSAPPNPAAFTLWDGLNGGSSIGTVLTGGARATQPERSADDSLTVFVTPSQFFPGGDDDHFVGGSLRTISYDAATNSYSFPQALVASGGENNYAPAFSPDSPPSAVVFNRVAGQGALVVANDAFFNPNARVLFVSASGGVPVDAARLNGAGPSTNSWPRFAPVVGSYKGHRLAWVTFTSTRDYGFRVRNSQPVDDGPQVNCYPPESPENPTTVAWPTNCVQPQLWMAAIDLTALSQSSDPSFTPFWFPYQDPTVHVRQGQWTTGVPAPAP
jgi:hypothetical protein